jgi:hypothetical protein
VHPPKVSFPHIIRLAHGAYRHKLGSEIERVNSLVPLERHGLSTSLPLVPHQSFIALLKNALHPGDTEMRTTLTISQSCAPSLLAWSITSCSLPAAITLYSHRETSYVSGPFDRLRATIWLRDRPLAEPVTVMGNVPLGMFDAAERTSQQDFYFTDPASRFLESYFCASAAWMARRNALTRITTVATRNVAFRCCSRS